MRDTPNLLLSRMNMGRWEGRKTRAQIGREHGRTRRKATEKEKEERGKGDKAKGQNARETRLFRYQAEQHNRVSSSGIDASLMFTFHFYPFVCGHRDRTELPRNFAHVPSEGNTLRGGATFPKRVFQ